jgi:hypothetical protein
VINGDARAPHDGILLDGCSDRPHFANGSKSDNEKSSMLKPFLVCNEKKAKGRALDTQNQSKASKQT